MISLQTVITSTNNTKWGIWKNSPFFMRKNW